MKIVEFLRSQKFVQLIRFSVIGVCGIGTNLLIFLLLIEFTEIPPLLSSVFCYVLSATQNYLANHYWTFSHVTSESQPSLLMWAKFLSGSCLGLIINLITLYVTEELVPHIIISQALGLALAFFANYTFSIRYVFIKSNLNRSII